MGLDATIRFRPKGPFNLDNFNLKCNELRHSIFPDKLLTDELGPFYKVSHHVEKDDDNLYELNTHWRYWSIDYPRGPMAEIALVLLYLIYNHPNWDVYYHSDSADTGSHNKISEAEVLGLLKEYFSGKHNY